MKKILLGSVILSISMFASIVKEPTYYVGGQLPYSEYSIINAIENNTSCKTLSAITAYGFSGNVQIYCNNNTNKYILKNDQLIKEY